MNKLNKMFTSLIAVGIISLPITSYAQVYGKDTAKKVISNAETTLQNETEITLKDITSDNISKLTSQIASNQKNSVRLNKIKQVAFEYGANVGRAEQSRYYEKLFEINAAKWDRDWDFSKLLIHQNPAVLPPIISQGFDNFKSFDRTKVQVSRIAMKIEVPAQIVTSVPTWRDYLNMTFTVDKHPSANFQPQTKQEKEVWDKAVKEGYAHGKQAADVNFENAYGELRRDYQSMLNYKIALANGDIDPVIIQVTDLGNVIDENGNVSRQDEMMIQIVKDAQFNKQKIDANRTKNPTPARIKLPTGKNM